MSGRFVIKWRHASSSGALPWLKVSRRFSAEKKKTVPVVDWEPSPATATQYGSAEAAMNEWERLGYAKAEYVCVIEL